MKKGRFLWSAHRITERQKAGKARSIKGKQLKNSRSTVSKRLAALRSSASVKELFICNVKPQKICFSGVLLYLVLVKKYVGLAECPDFGTPKVVSYDYLMNFEVIII